MLPKETIIIWACIGTHLGCFAYFGVHIGSSRRFGYQVVGIGKTCIGGQHRQSNTHLHGSPCRVRPHPFPRAHKREESGGVFGTINSPKVTLKGCEKGPE